LILTHFFLDYQLLSIEWCHTIAIYRFLSIEYYVKLVLIDFLIVFCINFYQFLINFINMYLCYQLVYQLIYQFLSIRLSQNFPINCWYQLIISYCYQLLSIDSNYQFYKLVTSGCSVYLGLFTVRSRSYDKVNKILQS